MQCQRRDHIPREDCPGDIRMSPVIPNHANRKKYPPLLFFILLFVFSLVLYWGRAILCVVVFQLTTWKKNISSWSHLLKVLSWVKKISADFFRCLSPQKRLMSRTSTSRNCRLTAAIRELLSISILREGKQGWKLVLTRMMFYWIFKKKIYFFVGSLLSGYTRGFQGCLLGFWPRRQSPWRGCLSLLSIDIHSKN